jgi:hypothetical protein
MEQVMKTPALALAAAVLAFAPVVTAHAEPLQLSRSTVVTGVAKVHKYCDQQGRCWTEGHRNMLLATYALAPPPRYVTSRDVKKFDALMSARAEARAATVKPRIKARTRQ